MKFLPILLLLCFSFNAKADLTLDNDVRVIVRSEKKTDSENKNVNRDVIRDIIKNKEAYKVEYELITTSNDVYRLILKPSENAQKYTLKITKDNNVYADVTYFASARNIEHKIQLTAGTGLYKVDYTEMDSANSDKIIYKKYYSLVYNTPTTKSVTINKPVIKTSRWVQALDPIITSLSSSITSNVNGEMEKVFAIDAWITKNIIYNYSSTMMSQAIDAITTLKMKMAICTGYSNLFAALARASGLEARAITGKARFDGKKYYHQWNEVKIDGVWYFIDTTWNAGRGKRSYFSKATQYPETHYARKEVKIY